MKIIDVSFYADETNMGLAALIRMHEPALGYAGFIKQYASIQFIKHQQADENTVINGIKYSAFKSRNSFWHIPFKTIKYIKEEKPDVVIVQGFIFLLQVAWLRRQLGKDTIMLMQNHGEIPFTEIKGWLQRKMDQFINRYLFTSIENATVWLRQGTISSKEKCLELLEASTSFTTGDKMFAKQQLGFKGDANFLWVGRLNEGKDPLTVVKAFETYSAAITTARLYMVYQTEELLNEIKKIIAQNNMLQQKIILVGKLPQEDLERWYNAADFYISGSRYESTGYTLLEAMACGCIPVVTNIPSFNKITENGKYGILYEAGNMSALLHVFKQLDQIDREQLSKDILLHFENNLSFKSIARNLFGICKELTADKKYNI